MAFSKPKPAFDRDRALRARPEHAPAVGREESDDGGVTIVIELEPRKWLGWLAGSKTVRRSFRLDKLGAEVYDACDGKTTTRSMVRQFAKKHEISVAEAEISVTQYLRTLVSKGLVVVAVDREPQKGGK